MADLDRNEELSSSVENGSCNSNEGTNPETSSTWIQNVVKVRKPYKVTKQREKWSEEEHERFLEAIKLYGRAWRQIQEHIGTKTAVQIRSHAQKFFSKMAREADKAVVIPPPRPKRKPAHPYPRKSPFPYPQSPCSNLSAMEKGTNSPTSVLSAFTSEDQINRCSSPNSCTSDIQSIGGKQSLKEDAFGSTPISSITLFGKIVLVAESHKPSSSCRDDHHLKSMGQENHYSGIKNSTFRHVDIDLSLGVWESSCTGSNAEPINSPWKRLEKQQESCYPANGIRPYKRCLSEREVTSSLSLVASEEESNQRRARVCS